jgi:alpha-methylacyl-CoA racemase
MAALWERQRSGRGQVVDAAMVDGAAALGSIFWGLSAAGQWQPERGSNLLDGGAPFYACYETSDGRWMSLAALEPKFFAEAAKLLQITLLDHVILGSPDGGRIPYYSFREAGIL